jgi:hypothetical protein
VGCGREETVRLARCWIPFFVMADRELAVECLVGCWREWMGGKRDEAIDAWEYVWRRSKALYEVVNTSCHKSQREDEFPGTGNLYLHRNTNTNLIPLNYCPEFPPLWHEHPYAQSTKLS